MKIRNWIVMAAAAAAVHSQIVLRSHGGLFKLDFGSNQNDADNVTLTDWDVIGTFLFTDFPDNKATWKLTDYATDGTKSTNVTLTITDNDALSAQVGAPALGMTGNNPTHEGVDVVYDTVKVPYVVKDDYLYRNPDTAGTELLFRFANLTPGRYNVTLFLGRTTDNDGQFGKVWVDDATGKKEPTAPNTGNFAGSHHSDPNDPTSAIVVDTNGNPQTVTVDIGTGDYLWYAHMEDNSGGISGMIIRSVTPLVDSDGDGMPDDWEIKYGLNPHDPSDAAKDCNNNGVTNLEEYKLGLDPCDVTPPAVLTAEASGSMNTVKLTFSKTLDVTGATNAANYTITPSLAVTGATYKNNAVTLTTAKQTPGTAYTISFKGIQDLSKNQIPASTKATFNSYVLGKKGVMKFSYYGNATGGASIDGTSLDALTSDARYPSKPDLVLPVYSFNSRDAFPDDSHDNYGATIEGLLTPKESGNYTFFLRSDDSSQLWLSTNDSPANLVLIAEETGCCQAFLEPDPNQGAAWHDNGNGMGQSTLTPIPLAAGKSYYTRLLYKEGGGADYGQVAWRKDGDTTAAGKLKPITADFISSTEDLPIPPSGTAPAGGTTATIARSGNSLTISWAPSGGTLQSSPAVGPTAKWTDVGTANPAKVTIGPASTFYRIKQ